MEANEINDFARSERPGAGDPLRIWRYVDPGTETSLWWAMPGIAPKLSATPGRMVRGSARGAHELAERGD
ncbi:MAG: hypothetical protein ACRDSJ_18145 [Rubrobacteraceae bacterium]